MPFISKAKQTLWTHHAEAKMAFYRLSKQRIMRVIHAPKRTEEGVAPKTVAMMQPVSVHTCTETVLSDAPQRNAERSRRTPLRFRTAVRMIEKQGNAKEIWSQEIWVMVQDLGKQRKIISAWRYPGMTRPKSEVAMDALRREYREFLARKNK